MPDRPSWWPDWRGPCVIAASGPSQNEQDVAYVRGRAKLIVVNDTWRMGRWADALYGSDQAWWDEPGKAPAPDEFAGLRISSRIEGHPEVVNCYGIRGLPFQPTGYHPGGGGNSGFQAMNLAYLIGCRPVILIGFDAQHPGEHWHGRHPAHMMQTSQSSINYWHRSHFDAASKIREGEIVNCSRETALRMYPRASLRSVL